MTADPQAIVRRALTAVHIDVPEGHVVTLTDTADTGLTGTELRLNPGQVTTAAEQHRMITGEAIDGDQLVDALPWANEGAA